MDDGKGGKRPSSAAYEDDPDGSPTSVTIAEESTMSRCLDPVRALTKLFAVAEFPSQAVRDKGLALRRDPIEDEPAHAVMEGKKTKSVRNYLARNSKWVHEPNAPYPPPEGPEAPEPCNELELASKDEGKVNTDGLAEALPSAPETASARLVERADGESAPGLGTVPVVIIGASLVVGLLALGVWLLT